MVRKWMVWGMEGWFGVGEFVVGGSKEMSG